MLSSLTSFLPSRLQGPASKDLPRPTIIPDEQSDDELEDEPEPPARSSQPENKPVKSKDRDGKGPSEVFVFVRPPPSISNHPLNLQVQLVPPNAKLPSGVPSTPISSSSTATAFSISDGTSLCRTPSNQSQNSFKNSSTTSFASFASSSGSSGTRRAIIPLYNLQAHNVMQNVIVDAGTDAKIAKFQKRGVELIDLAFLEPVEVWGERDGRGKDADVDKRLGRESMRLSVDEAGVVVTNLSAGGSVQGGVRPMRSTGSFVPSGGGSGSGTGPVALPSTPSAISLISQSAFGSAHGGSLGEYTSPQDSRQLRPSVSRASVRSDTKSPLSSSPITPTAFSPSDQSSAPTPKKNIFGKLFNKKSGVAPSTPSSTPTNTTHSSKQTEGLPSFASFGVLQPPKILQPPKQVPEDSDESILQTPTAPKEKSHGRNLSLTGITAPIKTTLKHNRNRISGLVNGMSPSSNANSLGALGISQSAPQARLSVEKGRDASPNPSVARSTRSRLSWIAASTTTQSTDSLPTDNGPKESDVTITGTIPTQLQTYPLMITPSHPEGIRQPQPQQFQLRPPVLGCQPMFVSSAVALPPMYLTAVTSPLVAALSPRMTSEKDVESLLQGQRALMYVWLVRKWLKRRVSTILGGGEATAAGLVGGLFAKKKETSASGQDMAGPPPLPHGGVEVRFEWKRKGREAKGVGRRSRTRRMASGASSIGDIGVGSDGEVELRGSPEDPFGRVKREGRRKHRMSTGSFATVSEENGLGLRSSPGSKQMRRDGEDGEESDPEDSETPWVCTLKIRRSAAGSAASANGGRISPAPPTPTIPSGLVPLEPQVLRVKVGTLTPTPHHPKVVAMLKVPFPLPDVEVERMGLVKRDTRSMRSTSTGGEVATATKEPYLGLTLTAEEIKDLVCSTGLWLVVREGFGGVGKVTRKGDGWRIRP